MATATPKRRNLLSGLQTGLFLCVAACASVAAAQQLDINTNTPQAGVGHNYIQALNEIVNPATESVSIRIQTDPPAQRAPVPPIYAYLYDSSGTYAVSYVSLNPVRAKLVSRAEEWPWSSVRAHLAGKDDGLVSVRPVLDRWPDFRELLLDGDEGEFTSLRAAEGIGRPLGTADFVKGLERRLGRPIARRAPGRRATAAPLGEQLNLLQ
jgi:hypothetical protein